MGKRSALVAGATGLVGLELVKTMLHKDLYQKITVLTRSPFPMEDDRLEVILLSNFDQMADHTAAFNAHDVFCCLGTTRKQAGSKAQFRKIDLEYPLRMAKIAKSQPEFKKYHIVTALGANADSALYYNRIKGELEDELKGLQLPALKIYRPSLLLGKRKQSRFLEDVAKAVSSFLSFFVIGVQIGRLWSIKAEEVAAAMYKVAEADKPGIETFSPRQMVKLAHK
jgi:uncharacterized protein YbjT (DUF2867 family)